MLASKTEPAIIGSVRWRVVCKQLLAATLFFPMSIGDRSGNFSALDRSMWLELDPENNLGIVLNLM
jgi:hypothetical protein